MIPKVHVAYAGHVTPEDARRWAVWCDCCHMLDCINTTYDAFAVRVGSHGVTKRRTHEEALRVAIKHTQTHRDRRWIPDISF